MKALKLAILIILILSLSIFLTGCGKEPPNYKMGMDFSEPFTAYQPKINTEGGGYTPELLAKELANAYFKKTTTPASIESQQLRNYKIRKVTVQDAYDNCFTFSVKFDVLPKSEAYIAENGEVLKNGWIKNRYYLMYVEKVGKAWQLTKIEINRY